MVDGVVLVVDAYEGTMPQTVSYWKKALEQDLVPIVVVNKIDKPSARPEEVVDEVLNSSSNWVQMMIIEFPVVYASAINGTSSFQMIQLIKNTMAPIFLIPLSTTSQPQLITQMSPSIPSVLLDYNDFVGRIGIGRIFRGTVKSWDQVTFLNLTVQRRTSVLPNSWFLWFWNVVKFKKPRLVTWLRSLVWKISSLGKPSHQQMQLKLFQSFTSMNQHFKWPSWSNNSPFAGREGKWVTSRKVEERFASWVANRRLSSCRSNWLTR